jgi:glycogen operon protein
MVKTLHSAGIEVILDVVYNHTAEGNHAGPTLSFRGIDNAAYYRLVETDRRYYMDYTGCGNTLNMQHPRVLQLIMDSLRYWITEMHVDGFRFDLASALARELHAVDRLGAFFDIIHQDPIISRAKLIAEPWDLGEGGYQVGQFPAGWTEWNGKYRDVIRAFWKGDGGLIGEVASRLSGSSDLYGHSGRRPYASINFVAAHDGFTLRDLVSYNHKHNDANGEDNRDGDNHNLSWNCGVEGPTDDPEIKALRARQVRNLFATLCLSQGVPMLSGGDEIGRTQHGNNNAYCQDSTLSWTDWSLDEERSQLFDFVCELMRLRAAHPVFRRRNFFRGHATPDGEVHDIRWLDPAGTEMTEAQWHQGFARCLGVYLSGSALDDVTNLPTTIFCCLMPTEPRAFVAAESSKLAMDIAHRHASGHRKACWKNAAPGEFSTGRPFDDGFESRQLAQPVIHGHHALSKSTNASAGRARVDCSTYRLFCNAATSRQSTGGSIAMTLPIVVLERTAQIQVQRIATGGTSMREIHRTNIDIDPTPCIRFT